jgi:hypothetical protein
MRSQVIKREPVTNTETSVETAPAPEPVPPSTSTEQAEASIPTDPVINGPNLNRTVTVRRKAAKRTDPLYIEPPPPQNMAVSLPPSPMPRVEDIPVTQGPRGEEPLSTTRDEDVRETASPEISEGLPSPATPPSAATVDVSTRRQSRRQTHLPRIEKSEVQLDDSVEFDDADADDSDLSSPSWEDRLSELADYGKIHGHCNVPQRYSQNTKLGIRVTTQRRQYRLHAKGKTSSMTPFRIQKLESLGFEWDSHGAAWEDSLSKLADYRKIHEHCNVP